MGYKVLYHCIFPTRIRCGDGESTPLWGNPSPPYWLALNKGIPYLLNTSFLSGSEDHEGWEIDYELMHFQNLSLELTRLNTM